MCVMQKMRLIHCLHWFNQNRPIGFQYTIAKKEAMEDNDQVIKLANQALANTKDKHFMAGLFMLQAWAYKKRKEMMTRH